MWELGWPTARVESPASEHVAHLVESDGRRDQQAWFALP